jgi:hypothetical protein
MGGTSTTVGTASDGGGAGSTGSAAPGNGTVNTGGGGGGSGGTIVGDGVGANGGSGGSGVVIIKYSDVFTISNPGGGLTFTTSTSILGFKVTTFTAGTGNIQFA